MKTSIAVWPVAVSIISFWIEWSKVCMFCGLFRQWFISVLKLSKQLNDWQRLIRPTYCRILYTPFHCYTLRKSLSIFYVGFSKLVLFHVKLVELDHYVDFSCSKLDSHFHRSNRIYFPYNSIQWQFSHWNVLNIYCWH